MSDTTPAGELRAAADKLRATAIPTAPAVADVLTAAADLATAYPELAHDHDRPACGDYTCDLMGRTLALARHVTTAPRDGLSAPLSAPQAGDDTTAPAREET